MSEHQSSHNSCAAGYFDSQELAAVLLRLALLSIFKVGSGWCAFRCALRADIVALSPETFGPTGSLERLSGLQPTALRIDSMPVVFRGTKKQPPVRTARGRGFDAAIGKLAPIIAGFQAAGYLGIHKLAERLN
jgi:hypothetical protein